MVDAAVGGKTGINTGAGKNLVGSFHEPAGVLCDLDLLGPCPPAELVAGLGEVIKCGFIADPEILRVVEADPAAVLDPASPQLREVIERAIQVKIDVVVGDLKETGGADGHPGSRGAQLRPHHGARGREGHRLPGPPRRGGRAGHGLRRRAGPAGRPPRRRDGCAARRRCWRPSACPPGSTSCPSRTLLATMRVDKKSRGSVLRFVVLDGLAKPAVLADPTEDDLRAAYDR